MTTVFEGQWVSLTGTQFDGTSSDINFGTKAVPAVTKQTLLAYVRPIGTAGSLHRLPLISRGNHQVAIIIQADGASQSVEVDTDSTGRGGCPTATYSLAAGPGAWQHIATTYDGTLNASGIAVYEGNPLRLASIIGFDSLDGLTAVSDAAASAFHLGSSGTNHFNGTIAYIARWNRVLSLGELKQAQSGGPYAVPKGLFFLWANRQEFVKGYSGVPSQTNPANGALQSLAYGPSPKSSIYIPGLAGAATPPATPSGGGDPAPLPSLGLLLGPSSGTHRFTSDALSYAVTLQNTSPRVGHKVSSAALSYSLSLKDSSPVKVTPSANMGGDPAPLPSIGLNLSYSGAKRYVTGPIQYTVAMQSAVLNKGHEFNGLPIGFTVEIAPSQSDYVLFSQPMSYALAMQTSTPLKNQVSFNSSPLSFTTTLGVSAFSTGGTNSVYNSPPLGFSVTLGDMSFGPRAYLFDSDPLDFQVQYAVITQVKLQWGEVTQAAGTWTQVTKNTASWS